MPATDLETSKGSPPASRIGRDEMNLSELPIALADRSQSDEKTIYFENDQGRLTVTSSDAYGLPTSADSDVIVALMYLTKKRNNFKEQKVQFSRYEVLELLGWGHDGDSYKRLDESFNRWMGVTLIYDKCWYDNAKKRNVSAKMHILEDVIIADAIERKSKSQSGLPLSSFSWNKTFIQSCQADNLRPLDLDTYFTLKSGVAKRLYRFLGKRFFIRGDWTFSLEEIAFDRIGLTRSYKGKTGKIKEKLDPAIKKLEDIGFLEPLDRQQRYQRVDRGHWTIRLSKPSPALFLPDLTQTAEAIELPASPITAELIARGVTAKTASDLTERHTADAINLKIEVFDWLASKADKRIGRSPAGYLVKSISEDYANPKGFVSKAERERRETAHQAEQDRLAASRRAERAADAREKKERRQINAFWDSLTVEQQAALQAEADAKADPAEPDFMKSLGQHLRRTDHIRQLLRDRQLEEA